MVGVAASTRYSIGSNDWILLNFSGKISIVLLCRTKIVPTLCNDSRTSRQLRVYGTKDQNTILKLILELFTFSFYMVLGFHYI